MDTKALVQQVIDKVGDLPAMPTTVAEVLRLTQDMTVGMDEVSAAIERDPALTAKILRISNSSYYGMRQSVGTLKLALVILGVREVRNIVLGISVFDTLHDDKADTLLASDLKEHSLLVAGIAKKLGTEMKLNFQGEDFIAGLLHDMGKMVLLKKLGEKYLGLVRIATYSGEDLCGLERDALGFSHGDAASALAAVWSLPASLADALRLHHPAPGEPLSEAKDPKLAAVVRIADSAAHGIGVAAGPDGAPSPTQDVLDGLKEAWSQLGSAPAPIPEGRRVELLTQFSQEVGASDRDAV